MKPRKHTPTTHRPDWLIGQGSTTTSFWDTPLRTPTVTATDPATAGDDLAHLADLLAAGAAPADALATLAAVASSSTQQRALTAASELVHKGASVADALGSTGAIPPSAHAHVRVAHLTGDLPAALRAAAADLAAEARRARAHRWSLLAPAVTLAAVAVLVCVVFTAVTPALLSSTPAGALPWYAQLLLWVGRLLPVPATGLLLVASAASRRSPTFAVRSLRRAATRLIPDGTAARTLAQEATWAAVASAVLRAGHALPDAAAVAAAVTDTVHGTTDWQDASNAAPDTGTLAAHLPAHASTRLRSTAVVAQRTGQLPNALERCARTAEDESRQRTESAASLATPVAATAVALTLAVFTTGVLLPVVNLLR